MKKKKKDLNEKKNHLNRSHTMNETTVLGPFYALVKYLALSNGRYSVIYTFNSSFRLNI